VRPVAQRGFDAAYFNSIDLNWGNRPGGHGSVGVAIRSGQTSLARNLSGSPSHQLWRNSHCPPGTHALIALPLKIDGGVLGVLAIHAAQPDAFDGGEIKILELLASTLAFGLDAVRTRAARVHAEETLLWKTAFFEAQVDAALDGILVVDSHGKKILQNTRLNELWKFPRHIIEDTDVTAQVRFAATRTKNAPEFAEKVAYLHSHPDEISRDEVELKNGTVLDRYSSPVLDSTGKYYGRIWSFRDITPRSFRWRGEVSVDGGAAWRLDVEFLARRAGLD